MRRLTILILSFLLFLVFPMSVFAETSIPTVEETEKQEKSVAISEFRGIREDPNLITISLTFPQNFFGSKVLATFKSDSEDQEDYKTESVIDAQGIVNLKIPSFDGEISLANDDLTPVGFVGDGRLSRSFVIRACLISLFSGALLVFVFEHSKIRRLKRELSDTTYIEDIDDM